MIIQRENGKLVNVATGATYLILPFPDESKMTVVLRAVRGEDILHQGNGDDCAAFLKSLAVRLGAVRWNESRRAFVPVKGDSDG